MITKVNENYILTKTLILSGIQCEKKLWYNKNDKIKVGAKALFEAGNRFNDTIRKHYGQGLDLSDEILAYFFLLSNSLPLASDIQVLNACTNSSLVSIRFMLTLN